MQNMIDSEHERLRQDGEPDREGVGKPDGSFPVAMRDADREVMGRIERFPLSNTPWRNERRSRGCAPGNWRLSSRPESGAANAAKREHAAASESSVAKVRLPRKSFIRVIQWNESGKARRFSQLDCKTPALHAGARSSRFRPANFCAGASLSSAETRQVATC